MTVPEKRKITDFFSVSKKAKKEEKAGSGCPDESNRGSDQQVLEVADSSKPGSAGSYKTGKFDKKQFIESLTEEQKDLLQLELTTLEDSWFELLHEELTKPYFLQLKKFLKKEWSSKPATIFPPQEDIYSWSRLTPLNSVKVLIIGQDPYHNFNQAHGLAFSVKDPNTRTPPSLVNIFKELENNYPDNFKRPAHSDLTQWAKEGVLLLNTCLTVEAHKANSHSKHGWEIFTSCVVKKLIQYNKDNKRGLVVVSWGRPAQKLVNDRKGEYDTILYLSSVHPSPLSASRGFFNQRHFIKTNDWLSRTGRGSVDWNL